VPPARDVFIHYNKSESAANELVANLEKQGGKAFAAGADLTQGRLRSPTLSKGVQSHWDSLDQSWSNNAGDLVQRAKIENFTDSESC